MLPLAHTGHWLWALYLPPVLIVLLSIVRTTLAGRRGTGDDGHEADEADDGDTDAGPKET